jgi:hypothetical protein
MYFVVCRLSDVVSGTSRYRTGLQCHYQLYVVSYYLVWLTYLLTEYGRLCLVWFGLVVATCFGSASPPAAGFPHYPQYPMTTSTWGIAYGQPLTTTCQGMLGQTGPNPDVSVRTHVSARFCRRLRCCAIDEPLNVCSINPFRWPIALTTGISDLSRSISDSR